MPCNEESEMPAFDTAPSTPTPEVITPMNGEILITREVAKTSERIQFKVEDLIGTPLSDGPWRLYRVPADQIELIHSDWYQIRLAPGICVVSSSYGAYQVAVNELYVQWLSSNMFTFQCVDPMLPTYEEELVQGKRAAACNADVRFVQDAVKIISSKSHSGLVLTYRDIALDRQKVPIEWTILMRDVESDTHTRTKFAQGLVLIILGCCDNYESLPVLALLKKNESEILQSFRSLYRQGSAYHTNSIASGRAGMGAAQIAIEFHRISMFRHLYEAVGGEKDPRQHKTNQRHTFTDNVNIIGSAVGMKVSRPFSIFDSQKMLDALSKSPLFPDKTIPALDFVKLSSQMIANLLIRFRDGHSDIPLKFQDKLSCGDAVMLHAKIAHFYHEHPSLQMPRNNILVLISWSSIWPAGNSVLHEWAASDDGLSVYERIIKDIQDPQPTEQLVLALASLLSYQRLLPFTPSDPNQPIKGSYQSDFDAILNGEHLGNERKVFERMGASILRVFYTTEGNQGMRLFLASVLHIDSPDIDSPDLDPSDEFSDQYWVCRLKNRSGHINMAGLEKMMAAVDNEGVQKEEEAAVMQELEATTTNECRVHLPAFPKAVFRLNLAAVVEEEIIVFGNNKESLEILENKDEQEKQEDKEVVEGSMNEWVMV